MAINGNLPNQTNNSASTSAYFNNFYDLPQTTSPMINDAVVAFFQKITNNADTGRNLAAAVIYTALQQGIDPMSVVDQLKALNDKNAPETYYSHETNDQAQDDYVFDSQTGTWTTGIKQYAKPGPSTPYSNITELDAYLVMLLNLNRVGTSLLGISNSPRTSPYVERMILA